MKKFYITTAIDYVNAQPHLGHAYEKIIADTIARWKKINGYKVFFLTGTDENAIKIAKAAKEAGARNKKEIKKFVDENAEKFKQLCKVLNIDYSYFIRTTDKKHIKCVKKFFNLLLENGHIYKSKYKGLYCISCEAFYRENEAINGLCPIHKKKLEEIEEENYFFKLSKFKQKIIEAIEKGLIKPERYAKEILYRLNQEDLKDLSVSRKKLIWGIKVPFDKSQTIYVWVDALINYISALNWPKGRLFKNYWPADMHVIGKDINWFHSVIWPALLMANNIDIPKLVFVHGFINIKGEKLSKTTGTIVDPFYLVDKYGCDSLRYYLIKSASYGDDFDFDENEIKEANNELADKYGNLISRVFGLAKKVNNEINKVNIDKNLKKLFNESFNEIRKNFDEYNFNLGIKKILELLDFCNKYIQDKELWKIDDKNELNKHLYFLLEAIRIITIFLFPIIPNATSKVANNLNFEVKIRECKFEKKEDYKINKIEILFKKL